MGEITMDAGARPTVFLRNATGLVKAWSTYDASIYSFMSINLVTLGLNGMSFAYAVPDGHLLPAVIFTGIAVTFLVVVYAALIAAIPRALGTIIAATILPWRRRDIYAASPIAQFRVGGVPVITIAGLLTSAFLIYNLVKWATDAVYGLKTSSRRSTWPRCTCSPS
jgi:hypothetical protein